MDKVDVLTVQIQPQIGERCKNFEKVDKLIEKNSYSKLDLIVLPEFFNTGVDTEAFKKLCEKEEASETLTFCAEIAKKYSSYIVTGSIIESDGDKLFNTSWLLDRNGKKIEKYRKIHLFNCFGGTEHHYVTPGEKIIVADTDFGKIGMSVCFDIKFPRHHLELVKMGAQIIVAPAAWCAPNALVQNACEEWDLMNKARAFDNLAYFISSNLCGKIDDNLSACGNSKIVGFDGKVISSAQNEEATAFAQIDIELLNNMRSKFCMDKL